MACPECGSTQTWKDGIRYSGRGSVQRYLCRRCGYRFSDPEIKLDVPRQGPEQSNSGQNLPNSDVSRGYVAVQPGEEGASLQICKDVRPHREHNVSITAKYINSLRVYNSERQVCVSESEAKNLAEVEPLHEGPAGATEQHKAEVKGKIIEFLWELKKQGLKESTIRTYKRYLSTLMNRGANLLDVESVKEVIAKQKWSESTRCLAIDAYSKFLVIIDRSWIPPKCKRVRKIPFIPHESELDQLISGAYKKLTAFLQLLKETGMRSGEAWRLKWTDIDFKRETITLNEPEKFGKPRMFKISAILMAMLNDLPKDSDKIFRGDLRIFRRTFRKYRKRMVKKLHNPRLNKITFHTFRHWKATTEYHKTKDILHVMELLGHRDIKTTLIYTQLISFERDEFHSATAKTLDEAEELVEAGFEYICTHNEIMLFRKRK